MRAILTLALKDLRVFSRDKLGLFWIFVFPLLYGLFFGVIFGGAGGQTRAIKVALVDEDESSVSQALMSRLEKSKAIKAERMELEQARERVLDGKLTAYVLLKKGYGQTGGFGGGPVGLLEVGIDPSRQAEAGMLQGVLAEANFAGLANPKELEARTDASRQWIENSPDIPEAERARLREFFAYLKELPNKAAGVADPNNPNAFAGFEVKTVAITANQAAPRSSFEVTFPSAILWGIMGCVATFAISLVTERTGGTLFRLKVSPASWMQILAGKALACFLTSCSVVILLITLGKLIFGLRIENYAGLALAIVCTSLCFTGLMMLMCTIGKTEQATAGAGWGLITLFAMIGGGMVPLFIMPEWMQTVSMISPVSWGIKALEGAIWRGYTLEKFLLPCGVLLGIGAASFVLGVAILQRREA